MAEYIDRHGTLWVDPQAWAVWQQIPHLTPTDCRHGSTACPDCWDSWMCDWEIRDTNPGNHGGRASAPEYPDVIVTLTGDDLAVADITGAVAAALADAHGPAAAETFADTASTCDSHVEILKLSSRFIYVVE